MQLITYLVILCVLQFISLLFPLFGCRHLQDYIGVAKKIYIYQRIFSVWLFHESAPTIEEMYLDRKGHDFSEVVSLTERLN